MVRTTNLQILPLTELEQGHTLIIAITNAQSAVTLQFRHADDLTWSAHPDFTAVAPVGNVIVKTIACVSPEMRLSFAAAPGSAYHVSWIPAAMATF